MADVLTIGVYGFDAETFLAALREARAGVVVDVRQRRGVRGSRYAWANSRRLQALLERASIGYRHLRQLAPTTELREAQYREDERLGVGKRSRVRLGEEYARRYTETILAPADLTELVELAGVDRPALLCVERDPEACHRSLIAERLERDRGLSVAHLRPEGPDTAGSSPSSRSSPR